MTTNRLPNTLESGGKNDPFALVEIYAKICTEVEPLLNLNLRIWHVHVSHWRVCAFDKSHQSHRCCVYNA